MSTLPKDCQDVLRLGGSESGVYTIYPEGTGGFQAYCDMTTDGGGWTVLLRELSLTTELKSNRCDSFNQLLVNF